MEITLITSFQTKCYFNYLFSPKFNLCMPFIVQIISKFILKSFIIDQYSSN
jgi:hypothetical protein